MFLRLGKKLPGFFCGIIFLNMLVFCKMFFVRLNCLSTLITNEQTYINTPAKGIIKISEQLL